jgi:hypothetical protein
MLTKGVVGLVKRIWAVAGGNFDSTSLPRSAFRVETSYATLRVAGGS